MDIVILPAGPIQTNTYLLYNPKTREAVVIDAGPESWEMVLEQSQLEDLKLKALLITHNHWDHTLDIHKFSHAGIPVYAHKDAVSQIVHPEIQSAMAFPGTQFVGCRVDVIIKHDDCLDLAGIHIQARDTPGHCPGSMIFYLPDEGCCFTGDLIFDGSVGRTDLPGGNKETLRKSIVNQVYTLPDETIIYPGHGSSTLVGKEKISNPFVSI